MQVDLIISHDKTVYVPVVLEDIQLTLKRSGSAGKLNFKVMQDSILNIDEGDHVKLMVDGTNVFYGFIFKRSFDKDGVVSITAYDQLIYLIKNKDTYVFTGKNLTQILKQIADDFNLQCGELADSSYVIPTLTEDSQTLMDIVQDAMDQTLTNIKEMFVLYDDSGKLTLKNIADMKLKIVIDETTAENYQYNTSIDGEVYNKIKLVYDNEETSQRDVYIEQHGENINKWGILQYYDKLKKGENGKAKAQALLKLYNQKLKQLKISNAFGDLNVRAGCLIPVILTLADGTEINNYMLIESVTHRFENNFHTMDLTVKGGNNG